MASRLPRILLLNLALLAAVVAATAPAVPAAIAAPEYSFKSSDSRAGHHPTVSLAIKGYDQRLTSLSFHLPAGMVGNPEAVTQCRWEDFAVKKENGDPDETRESNCADPNYSAKNAKAVAGNVLHGGGFLQRPGPKVGQIILKGAGDIISSQHVGSPYSNFIAACTVLPIVGNIACAAIWATSLDSAVLNTIKGNIYACERPRDDPDIVASFCIEIDTYPEGAIKGLGWKDVKTLLNPYLENPYDRDNTRHRKLPDRYLKLACGATVRGAANPEYASKDYGFDVSCDIPYQYMWLTNEIEFALYGWLGQEARLTALDSSEATVKTGLAFFTNPSVPCGAMSGAGFGHWAGIQNEGDRKPTYLAAKTNGPVDWLSDCSRLDFTPELEAKISQYRPGSGGDYKPAGGEDGDSVRVVELAVVQDTGANGPAIDEAPMKATKLLFPRGFELNSAKLATCDISTFNADPESCPKRSISGRLAAYSPVLDRPLDGYVYTLETSSSAPTKVGFALKGLIDVHLLGKVQQEIVGGRGLVAVTIDDLPQLPISRFVSTVYVGEKEMIDLTKCTVAGDYLGFTGSFVSHAGLMHRVEPRPSRDQGPQRRNELTVPCTTGNSSSGLTGSGGSSGFAEGGTLRPGSRGGGDPHFYGDGSIRIGQNLGGATGAENSKASGPTADGAKQVAGGPSEEAGRPAPKAGTHSCVGVPKKVRVLKSKIRSLKRLKGPKSRKGQRRLAVQTGRLWRSCWDGHGWEGNR